MIQRFGGETVLLMIDVQVGVDDLEHWGGPTGRRNHPEAEQNLRIVLEAWRNRGLPVVYTRHDSREANSPLRSDAPGFAFKPGLEPLDSEPIHVKSVNSGYIGTDLERSLRRAGITRIVHVGFFTNMCVESTVRMSGNMGFDSYLVDEACCCTNRLGPSGTDFGPEVADHDPELVHEITVANLHGEFCTNLTTADALSLLEEDAEYLDRVQGNE
jgi:nicotinamidase-related amidase